MAFRIRAALLAAGLLVSGGARSAEQIVPLEQEPQRRDTAAALEFTNVGDEVFHGVDGVVK